MKEFIEKLIGRLEEKFKYNSEQAEIYRDGSDKDAYFREKKDLYMDRANTYGQVMRIVNQLAEEYINTSTDASTTNADRIRSMTDEELAEFISKYFSCEYECAVRDKCGSDWDCKRATIDWLQSEVEGVTENE